MKTARELEIFNIANRVVSEWYLTADIGNGYISEKSGKDLSQALTTAFTAVVEEKDREIARLKAELIEGVKLVAEFTEEIKAKGQ